MEKDFDKWNDRKKELEKYNSKEELYFSNGDVWWIELGINL